MNWCVGARESKAGDPSEIAGLKEQLGALNKKLLEQGVAQEALKAVEAERDALKEKVEQQAAQLAVKPAGASAEEVQSLERERDAMKEQVERGVKAASQLETHRRKSVEVTQQLEAEREKATTAAGQVAEAQRQAKALQTELDSLKKKAAEEQAAKAKELDGLRTQVKALETEQSNLKAEAEKGKLVAKQLQESDKKVKELQEGHGKLQTEVETVKVEKRASLKNLNRSLSEISDKLDSAKTSWAPWEEINKAKEDVATIKNTIGEED